MVRSSTGKIGAGKLLKVMSGDKIHTSVQYYYGTNNSPGPYTGLSTLVNNLTAMLTNSTSAPDLIKSNAAIISSSVGASNNANTFFNNVNSNSNTSIPKAYLNVLFFNEQFKFDEISSYCKQIDATNPGQILLALGTERTASKNCFCYIYISNESDDMVYFDNLTLRHDRGRILEETHYYPFGLVMSGISSKAANITPNKEKTFQGQRFDDDLGLNWVQFKWRNHDPQIGRFIEIDPLAEDYLYNSTYAFSENKVTNHIELEGLEAIAPPPLQQSFKEIVEFKQFKSTTSTPVTAPRTPATPSGTASTSPPSKPISPSPLNNTFNKLFGITSTILASKTEILFNDLYKGKASITISEGKKIGTPGTSLNSILQLLILKSKAWIFPLVGLV